MNHAISMIFGTSGAPGALLLDCAVKGTALLLFAAALAVLLRRDSAAMRHFLWMLAFAALLLVPVLSALLPQWRVLPRWTSIAAAQSAPPADSSSIAPSARDDAQRAIDIPVVQAVQPVVLHDAPVAASSDPARLPASEAVAAPRGWNWKLSEVLPLAWAIGICVLLLRLAAARVLLWSSQSQSSPAQSADERVVDVLDAARSQLGIHRPIMLLIHPGKTIPAVWGVLRCRLLLPISARDWSVEQLRSVLLHELAHVKRGDAVAQLLAQIACAVHWFNPLAWFAARRLEVERERACDDLVLAKGVRPSAYAGHLLEAVAGLAPARWTSACGLAMARKSSLEGRLVAVLSDRLNRRGVSLALAAVALTITAGIVVPVAMLRAADTKPSEPSNATVPDSASKGDATLDAATEKRLKWGDTVNGLRAAVVIRFAAGAPKAVDQPDLYLAVQNMSDKPIRLSDTVAAPDLRALHIKNNGRIAGIIASKDPSGVDVVIQPGRAALLPMFAPDPKDNEHAASAALADSVLKDPQLTVLAKIDLTHAPAGAWSGKFVTGETTGAVAAGQLLPKDKQAQALFKMWQREARSNGDIPGGLIGRLGEKMKEFIHNNTGDASGDPYAKKMQPLLARIDSARDWTPAQAVALMNDIAAITSIPLETTMEEAGLAHTLRAGAPLPPALANAPWGPANASGLRVAWLLEPQAAAHRLNTALKSRVLFHNSGKNTVVFRAWSFYQVRHTARDAKGGEIQVDSTEWLTLARLVPFRLAPGEFAEVNAPGIGVGADKNLEDWQNVRVGSWVDARAGDDVTLTTDPVRLGNFNKAPAANGQPRWWLEFISWRLGQDTPIPDDNTQRTVILDRVTHDLFGTAPTAEETAAFLADHTPGVLESLAQRLADRAGVVACSGSLTSGPTRFHVLPIDPDADKKPRTANNPGRYTLADHVILAVIRRPVGERAVNEASIEFFSADPAKPSPARPFQLSLPDGYGTWAAAWVRGANVLWLAKENAIDQYDFSNPEHVSESVVQRPQGLDKVPQAIRDVLRDQGITPAPASQVSR